MGGATTKEMDGGLFMVGPSAAVTDMRAFKVINASSPMPAPPTRLRTIPS